MKDKQYILEPFHNYVIILQLEEDTKMYGNIIVADLGKEKPICGEVIARGPGVLNIGSSDWIVPSSEVGDKVLIPAFGGIKVTYNGVEYLIYKDSDILSKIIEK